LSIPSLAKLKFIILIAAALFFVTCNTGAKWNSYTLFFFDTVCDIKVFCLPAQVEATQKEISRIFTDIEEEFAPGSADLSSAPVLELFRAADRVYRDSDGYFDISVGPLSELWGFSTKAYRLPSPEEVQKILALVGLEKVKEEKGGLSLLPGMKLDWGGIAKGRGVDLAAKALQGLGIRRGFINCGGDLYCWGTNPENTAWKIGIKHPRHQGYLGVISISDTGIATSGDYQRYFESGGVRYHHIFNPKTGYPARGRQSVTVVGPETVYCDALSTALFASPQPNALIEKYPEYGAILVESNGSIVRLGKAYSVELL
jgi:thiamine biosynthesis lipoprotein